MQCTVRFSQYFKQISQIFIFPFNFELRGSMSLVFIECSIIIEFSNLVLSLLFPNFALRILKNIKENPNQ